MAKPKLPWTFERLRRLAYQRHRAQALFRGEGYDLSEDYWNSIWTEERFKLRGMRAECLCLSRRDVARPWAPGNLVLMTRQVQLNINNKMIHGIEHGDLYRNIIWTDHV